MMTWRSIQRECERSLSISVCLCVRNRPSLLLVSTVRTLYVASVVAKRLVVSRLVDSSDFSLVSFGLSFSLSCAVVFLEQKLSGAWRRWCVSFSPCILVVINYGSVVAVL